VVPARRDHPSLKDALIARPLYLRSCSVAKFLIQQLRQPQSRQGELLVNDRPLSQILGLVDIGLRLYPRLLC
jgi:hypothetical protein